MQPVSEPYASSLSICLSALAPTIVAHAGPMCPAPLPPPASVSNSAAVTICPPVNTTALLAGGSAKVFVLIKYVYHASLLHAPILSIVKQLGGSPALLVDGYFCCNTDRSA
jgi:hypothetical protein